MNFDVIVVGGGIVGASVAYHLRLANGASAAVLILEAEAQAGYHSTGRSAALFTESYGPPPVIALTMASRAFLEEPPAGFAEHPLLTPRGSLYVGSAGQRRDLQDLYDSLVGAAVPGVRLIDGVEALELCPALRRERVAAGLYESGAMDIDVHALHQGYLRGFKRAGGEIRTSNRVDEISRDGNGWCLQAAGEYYRAPVVVNAAGAWCDEIAGMAGVAKIGLVPKRRTAITFDPPAAAVIASWPNVHTIAGDLYFKPDAGRILASPADETPSPPVDAQPEEYDVAVTAARIEALCALEVKRIVRRWAGLRSFVADGIPVIGMDPESPGFFWAAGLGGYGVQTSPAVGQLSAEVILHGSPRDGLRVNPAAFSPRRIGRQC
jgi:D-arginine dehydrogenase